MKGAMYVGRAKGEYGRFGNPFKVMKDPEARGTWMVWDIDNGEAIEYNFGNYSKAVEGCLRNFRESTMERLKGEPDFLEPLKGKNLACWCPLDQPCHADILLELANPPASASGKEGGSA